jgi:rubrerythrin
MELGGKTLLSEIPIDLENINPEDINKEVLRAAMIAELDAVNFYEQMANLAQDEDIKKVLLEIAREEKVHVAMFESVLIEVDMEYLKIEADYALRKG